jgi:phenylalanyl-tRNA synthetase beta chain
MDYEAGGEPYLHPGRKARITAGGKYAGQLGELHPAVQGNYGLSQKVYVAEIELDALYAAMRTDTRFEELPKYPSAERDIALVVDASVQSGDIAKTLTAAAGKLLIDVTLFDTYMGKGIPEGKKSLAFSLFFRAKDHTLTDEEIAALMDKALKKAESDHGAALRA